MAERRLQMITEALGRRNKPADPPQRKRKAGRQPGPAPAPKQLRRTAAAAAAATAAEREPERDDGGEIEHITLGMHGSSEETRSFDGFPEGHPPPHDDSVDVAKIRAELEEGQLLSHATMHYFLDHFLTFPSFAAYHDLGNVPKDAASWAIQPPSLDPDVKVHVALLNVDCHWIVLVLQKEQDRVLVLDSKPGAAPNLATVAERVAVAFSPNRQLSQMQIQHCTLLPQQQQNDAENCGIFALTFLFYLARHDFKISPDFSIPNCNHDMWRFLLRRYWSRSRSSRSWIQKRAAETKACAIEGRTDTPTIISQAACARRRVETLNRLLVEASEIEQLSKELDDLASHAVEESQALTAGQEATKERLIQAEEHAVEHLAELLKPSAHNACASARKTLKEAYAQYWRRYDACLLRRRAKADEVAQCTAHFRQVVALFHADAQACAEQARSEVRKQRAEIESRRAAEQDKEYEARNWRARAEEDKRMAEEELEKHKRNIKLLEKALDDAAA